MIQIQCTNKLIEEFNIEPKEYIVKDELYKWHANIFDSDNMNYIVLINDLSYYGFVIYNIDGDFKESIKEAIKKNLLAQYASHDQVSIYLNNEIVFSKTSNKKVIGKMNALTQYVLHSFAYGEDNINRINLELGHYDFIDSKYVGDYIAYELDRRMPDKILDKSIFDHKAKKVWYDLPEDIRRIFIEKLYCYKCSSSDTEFIKIVDDKTDYRIEGRCNRCGGGVRTSINKERLKKFKCI